MNSQELFNLIKRNADYISLEDIIQRNALSEQAQQPADNNTNNVSLLVAEYNLKTFLEIKNRECIDVIEDINIDVLNEFTSRINKYLDKHAPRQVDLKKYILLISTYLTFIAKQPLHPAGLVFEGGKEIVSKDNKFYCPVKNMQLHEALSVCRYCVSRDSSAMSEGTVPFR
ncbi:DUF2115 family protein [Sporomusa sp.]|uniref:DUF2115 family protein n=1 Tax=Sporomusa sp. TaxID=2078658 RepID=UPI002CFEC2FB|nr:DUF2115 family protein [Sporomusa sp.]HWR42232.1 DUF2115 family protein [Sporomusa sp.]